MNPDSSQPPRAGQPNLPPLAPAPHPGQTQAAAAPGPAPASPPAPAALTPEELAVRAAAEARKVVQTYQADPYTQAQVLGQLKAQYLRDRYHINIDMAGQ